MYNLNYNSKMKTKFLLSALGLTAAFAACTNEDIIETTVNSAEFLGRKAVNVELKAEAGSRATTEGWEETDKIGSMLVDPSTQWTVGADAHLGNNRWDLNGNAFTTQGTTVEGAWMFYFPYDAQMSKERGALKVTKSIVNQQYDATGDKMFANDFAVSPIYFVNAIEGTQKIDVRLNSVYSYGNIVAALPGTAKGAKVSKVLLKFSNPFNNKLAIDAEAIAKISSMDYTSVITEDTNDENGLKPSFANANYKKWFTCDSTQSSAAQANVAQWALQDWVSGDKKQFVTDGFKVISDKLTEVTGNTSDYILINCAESAALADTTFATRVLLPARVETGKIALYIYTDKGVFSHEIDATTNYLYFKRGLKADLHNVNRVEGTEENPAPEYLTMAVADAATTPIVETSDLVNLIKQFTTAPGTTKAPMDVTAQLMGSVVFNDEVAEALAANNKISKLRVEDINIQCTKAQTIEKLDATGDVTVKAGSNITIGGVWKVLGKTTIETGATVNVAKNCGVGNSTTEIAGTLNISNGVKYTSTLKVKGGALTLGSVASRAAAQNETITTWIHTVETGSLTINVNTVSNMATTWGTDTERAAALTVAVNDTLSNNSTIEIKKNATVTFSGSKEEIEILSNAGTITNDAVLKVQTNTGTITNNGTLNVNTNNATINNNVSVITTKGKVVVGTNSATGVINTVTDSQTDIETANNGIIYFAENAFINGTDAAIAGNHTYKGNVVYKVAADMTAAELAAKIQNTKVTAIEVANAKLTAETGFEKLTALLNLKNISLNGSSEIVANDTISLVNCPVYVSGTNNIISGTCPINFYKPSRWSEQFDFVFIELSENASIETKAVINGLVSIHMSKGSMVVARTNIYGPTEASEFVKYLSVATAENTSWLGTAYEKQTETYQMPQ